MTSEKPIVHNVALSRVPSEDPLAFVTGYLDGTTASAARKTSRRDATAYVEGRALGERVARGEVPAPTWMETRS